MTSIIKVDQIQNAAGGTPTAADLGLNVSGTVLQVKQTYFGTLTAFTGSQAYTACTDSDCVITATQDNSKFLIRVTLQLYHAGGTKPANAGIYRDATLIAGTSGASGDGWAGTFNTNPAVNDNCNTVVREYLDSPSLSAGASVTYKAALGAWSGTGTVSVNIAGYSIKSSIVVQEIAG